jgi:hypothetical protein
MTHTSVRTQDRSRLRLCHRLQKPRVLTGRGVGVGTARPAQATQFLTVLGIWHEKIMPGSTFALKSWMVVYIWMRVHNEKTSALANS